MKQNIDIYFTKDSELKPIHQTVANYEIKKGFLHVLSLEGEWHSYSLKIVMHYHTLALFE